MDRSFLSIFMEDPRWQLGGMLAVVGALVLTDDAERLLRGGPGDFTTQHYVGAALLLAGALLVLLSVRKAAVLSHLARVGAVALGRVTGVKRAWPAQSYALRCRFRDSSGIEVEGRQFLSQTEAFAWREGNEGDVRFDAADSTKSVWLGRSDFGAGLIAPTPARSTASDRDVRPAPVPAALMPSQWKLFSRSRSIRSASLFFFYFLLTGLFLAVMALQALHVETQTTEDRIGFALYSLLVGALLVASVFKLVSGLREVAERRRVLRDGIAAEATVILVEKKILRSRGIAWSRGWIVSYRYRDRAGGLHDGESGFLSTSEAARWRVGDRCPIYYDTGRSGSSVWAG